MYRLMVKRRIDTKRFKEDQRFHTDDYDAMRARRAYLIDTNYQVRTETKGTWHDWSEQQTDTNPKRMHM